MEDLDPTGDFGVFPLTALFVAIIGGVLMFLTCFLVFLFTMLF
jgi:hypothetical protein